MRIGFVANPCSHSFDRRPLYREFLTVMGGLNAEEIARAYTVAHEVYEMESLWADIEALDNKVAAHAGTGLSPESRGWMLDIMASSRNSGESWGLREHF